MSLFRSIHLLALSVVFVNLIHAQSTKASQRPIIYCL